MAAFMLLLLVKKWLLCQKQEIMFLLDVYHIKNMDTLEGAFTYSKILAVLLDSLCLNSTTVSWKVLAVLNCWNENPMINSWTGADRLFFFSDVSLCFFLFNSHNGLTFHCFIKIIVLKDMSSSIVTPEISFKLMSKKSLILSDNNNEC